MSFLLTALAALLYALGWLAGKVSLVVGWCWSAVAVGWDEARAPRPREAPSRPLVTSGR